MRVAAARILAAALLALACSAAPAANPLIEGLDHVPVAVADLDRAAADFARLGFVIKPGRPHSDGIQNKHIKFPNGGEIELIIRKPAPLNSTRARRPKFETPSGWNHPVDA